MNSSDLAFSWQTERRYGTVLQIGWSGVQACRVFRKFYTHCPQDVSIYEYSCARWLYEHGIPSPRPISILNADSDSIGLEFEWLDLHVIRDVDASHAAQDLLALARSLHSCPIWPQSRSWQELVEVEYLPELARASHWCSNQLDERSLKRLEQAIAAFKDLRPDGFVHGDLSLDNVGYHAQILHAIDFRHCSEGPQDWDVGYFLCNLMPGETLAKEILSRMNTKVADLAVIAAAVRLGRRLRRGDDPVPGLHRLLEWMSWQLSVSDQAIVVSLPAVESPIDLMCDGLLDDAERLLTPTAKLATPQGRAARLNIAVIQHVRGNFHEAQLLYERELCSGEADHAALCNNLGILHLQLRHRDQSLEWLKRAQSVSPGTSAFAPARLAWFHSFRHYVEGIQAFQSLCDQPSSKRLIAIMHNTGASLYYATGNWAQASRCWQRAIETDPCHWNAQINYALAADGRIPAESLAKLANDALQRRLRDSQARRALAPVPRPARSPRSVLRLALVASRIRRGKTGYLLRALLNHLDRQEFEVVVYDNAVIEDRFVAPLKCLANRWMSIFGWSVDALAKQIRCDEIDILLDLDGCRPRNLSEAFAMKPAPLQLGCSVPSVWSNPQTLQMVHEDLVDFYSFDATVPISPSLSRTKLRIAYIGDADKLDVETTSLLCSVLNVLQHTILIIKSLDCDDPLLVATIAHRFASSGINRERIKFVGFVKGHAKHLAFHSEIDVVIDAVNRSSEIALYEALQHGVPVLTVDASAQDVKPGAKLLRRLGLSWLVASGTADIIHLCQLASSAEVLASWRTKVRTAFEAYQQVLPARGRALGATLRATWAECQPITWQSLYGSRAKYDIDTVDADGRWLALTSCYGDQVLLSTFTP